MIEQARPRTDVGVIIGRFQVHELHEAHRELIDDVVAHHDRVVVLLGISPLRGQARNPLSFQARQRMFREHYPDIDTWPLYDAPNDQIWSNTLDHTVGGLLLPHQSALLYGGRDSFVSHYHGRFPTCELRSSHVISGDEIRRRIANQYQHSKDFRAGLIAGAYDHFPTMYVAVDVAVVNRQSHEILLGRKANESGWRLPGGFSDPQSSCLEDDAKREVREETNLFVENLRYVRNLRVDDWRYRQSVDSVLSVLFLADYQSGAARAGDDLHEVAWFQWGRLHRIDLVVEHEPYRQVLLNHLFPEPVHESAHSAH